MKLWHGKLVQETNIQNCLMVLFDGFYVELCVLHFSFIIRIILSAAFLKENGVLSNIDMCISVN
jgi:hypothetical protein